MTDCIDHLMTFASEAAAQADPVVGTYYISDGQGGGNWRGDVTISGVEVYTLAADGVTHQDNPGWFIIISLPTLDPDLQNAGNGAACVLIADRDMANAGNPNFLLYTAPSVTQSVLQSTYVAPTFAGSTYPFANP